MPKSSLKSVNVSDIEHEYNEALIKTAIYLQNVFLLHSNAPSPNLEDNT